jgi:hypothetical protein
VRDIEIQKISKLEPAEAQIAQELATMNWQDSLDRFQFDYDPIVHQEIDSVSILNSKVLIPDGTGNLISNLQTLIRELMHKTKLIGAFQQSWTDR